VTALSKYEKSSATPPIVDSDLLDELYGGFNVTSSLTPPDLKLKQSGTLSFPLPHADREQIAAFWSRVMFSTAGLLPERETFLEVARKFYSCTMPEFISNNSLLRAWVVVTRKSASSTDSSTLRAYLDHTLGHSTADPLASYEKFSQPNWDGYSADPISQQTLNYARRLLGVMPETLGPPDIAPAADGSIALEWIPERHNKLDKLFLDIGPGEEWRAYWMLRDGSFGRLPNKGYTGDTKRVLDKLFEELSK
jgi:hypothetical protein